MNEIIIHKEHNQELATITREAFLNDFTLPAVQAKCRSVNDIPAVFESNMPTLGSIKRTFGYEFTKAYIEGWIVNIREFVTVGKQMTDSQTAETAMLIFETYPSLTLADINLIFKRAKLGKYGQLYDRLDGQIILSWFQRYFAERCNEAEEISIREADFFKEDLPRTSESIQEKEHAFKLSHFLDNVKIKKSDRNEF